MNVLKRINKLRIDRGWSIYRLSLESQIPQSTLTNMFNRETLPSISTLEMLCSAFGITLAEFFSEESTETPAISSDLLYEKIHSLPAEEKRIIYELVCALSSQKKS